MSVPKKDLIRRIIGWEVLEWSSFILDINLREPQLLLKILFKLYFYYCCLY